MSYRFDERRAPSMVRGTGASIVVKNLPYDTRSEDLLPKFERYGEVRDVYLPRDYYTGSMEGRGGRQNDIVCNSNPQQITSADALHKRSRGFGFVEYYSSEDATMAQADLDGTIFAKKVLQVQMSKHSRKTPQYMARLEVKQRGQERGRNWRPRRFDSPGRSRRPRSLSRSPPLRSYDRSRTPKRRMSPYRHRDTSSLEPSKSPSPELRRRAPSRWGPAPTPARQDLQCKGSPNHHIADSNLELPANHSSSHSGDSDTCPPSPESDDSGSAYLP